MSTNQTKRTAGRLSVLVALLILAGPQAFAQMPRPSLTIEGDLFGRSRLDNPPLVDLAGPSTKIGTVHLGGSLLFPVIVGQGKTIFFFEGKYLQRQYSFSNWPEGVSKDIERLHEISAGMTVRQAFGQKWAVTLNFTPQLATNFEGDKLEEEDFKFQGAAIFERTFNDRWTAGLGAAYSTSFGQPIPMPLVTFRYESGSRWHASGTLPSAMDVWYRLSSRLELGLVAHAEGGLYHIPGVFPDDSSIKDPEIQYISARFGPAIQTQFEGMQFTVTGGLAYQSLSLFDGTDEIDNSKYDLKPGAFVNAGFGISF